MLQADAFAGFNRLYASARRPGPLVEAACWAHARRKLFVLADIAAKACGRLPVLAPLALTAVKRIDAIFAMDQRSQCRPAARCETRAHGRARDRTGDLDAG